MIKVPFTSEHLIIDDVTVLQFAEIESDATECINPGYYVTFQGMVFLFLFFLK